MSVIRVSSSPRPKPFGIDFDIAIPLHEKHRLLEVRLVSSVTESCYLKLEEVSEWQATVHAFAF